MQRTKNRRGVYVGVLMAVLLTAASALADYREEFRKTYAVAPEVQVSLENVNGSVEISGWDRNEVEVSATKYADSKEKLARLKIEVDASNSRVAIRTRTPHVMNVNPGGVEYRIRVPRTAKLEKIDTVNGGVEISSMRAGVSAKSVNGNVTGRALSGDIELETVNGSVSCEAVDFANVRRVKLASVNGGVDFYMPRESGAHLTANTVHGGISSDFDLPIKRGMVGSNLDTKIGSGTTQVDLSSVNGGISIRGGSKGI